MIPGTSCADDHNDNGYSYSIMIPGTSCADEHKDNGYSYSIMILVVLSYTNTARSGYKLCWGDLPIPSQNFPQVIPA